jgi:hypothetical protein
MRDSSPLASAFDHRPHASYEVRVRGTQMYLWGSATIKVDATFNTPLLLHVRNNVFGQPIDLYTTTTSSATPLGTLQPGEAYTIPIQNMSGVYANCTGESLVDCLLQGAR